MSTHELIDWLYCEWLGGVVVSSARAVVKYLNIRILKYENSIQILLAPFKYWYVKLFEYSNIRILKFPFIQNTLSVQ